MTPGIVIPDGYDVWTAPLIYTPSRQETFMKACLAERGDTSFGIKKSIVNSAAILRPNIGLDK